MATSTQSMASSTPRVLATSALKGSRVGNFAGEDLGKVDDLVVDVDSGRLNYVIVSIGGFLGIGDKLFAVPWELFTVRTGDHEFLLDIEKQMLRDAPSFERSKWPDMSDSAWAATIHSHFAQKPYWNSDITEAGDYTGDDRLDKADRDRL
jgi:sporulation protein YlmC with PRC-barrel domain